MAICPSNSLTADVMLSTLLMADCFKVFKITQKRFENIFNTLKQSAISNVDSIKSAVKELNRQIAILIVFQRKLLEHESSIKGLLFHLDLLKEAITELNSGVLPSFLITPELLNQSFQEISNRAKKSSPSLRLISNNPRDYYKKAPFG